MLQELIARISSKKDSEELKSLLLAAEANHNGAPDLVLWHPDYQSACLAASRSRKPILSFQLTGDFRNPNCELSARYARQMLFSAPEIALLIMTNFEPAWQNVRNTSFEVTWHSIPIVWSENNECSPAVASAAPEELSGDDLYAGNIATLVCTADGVVLDILPGVYEPAKYLHELEQLLFLNEVFEKDGPRGVSQYHREQARVLKSGQPAKVFKRNSISVFPSDCGEQLEECETTEVLTLDFAASSASADSDDGSSIAISSTQYLMPSGDHLREWEQLQSVSSMNQRYRRIAIHDYLRKNPESSARQATKWLFREVFEIQF